MSANRVVVWSLWVLSLVLATHFGASAQFGPGQDPPGAEVRFLPSFGPSSERLDMPGQPVTGTFMAYIDGQWVSVVPESKGGLRPVDVRP